MKINMAIKLLLTAKLINSSIALSAENSTIMVAVAANFQYAFEELKTEFKKNSTINIENVFGSSGKLTAQIKNSAPFDMFISADTEYPEALCKQQLCASPAKIYAYGSLVLWTINNLDLNKGMQILAQSSIKKIALPNPQTAPYGREAIKALTVLQINKNLEAKFVFGESIAQASQYIASGAADLGFTAKSVVLSKEMLNKGKWIDVPINLYTPIAQAAIILKGKNEVLAKEFYNYLYSSKAKTILLKYGYKTP